MPSVAERLKDRAAPELDEIVQHCLRPRPEDRPADILTVKRALEKVRQRYPKPRFDDTNRLARPSPVRKRK